MAALQLKNFNAHRRWRKNNETEQSMKNALLTHVESKHLRANAPRFEVGDLVDVHCRIVEGDKERIQIFSGTVISRKGEGINSTFTVRRIVNNEGVERVFPVHSPKVEKLEIRRKSRIRRAKLYYLRDRTGKATRLREGAPIIPGAGATGRGAPAQAAAAPASSMVTQDAEPAGETVEAGAGA